MARVTTESPESRNGANTCDYLVGFGRGRNCPGQYRRCFISVSRVSRAPAGERRFELDMRYEEFCMADPWFYDTPAQLSSDADSLDHVWRPLRPGWECAR